MASGGDVDWPTTDELKQRLDITSNDWDDSMDRLMASAVEWVKSSVGTWDEDLDEPDEALAQAALERAVELATTGEAAPFGGRGGEVIHPITKAEAQLFGHRRRFGVG